ncbi:hypothetical protein BKA66DRAFT_236822 [Pyrenochaeta sp. MPI-SDFR-AT-0127]|nr:hypothetical protein BKA66DRAFT_236822 [Pyrenochaeta sp. MPI-SDFR-AT-0127]
MIISGTIKPGRQDRGKSHWSIRYRNVSKTHHTRERLVCYSTHKPTAHHFVKPMRTGEDYSRIHSTVLPSVQLPEEFHGQNLPLEASPTTLVVLEFKASPSGRPPVRPLIRGPLDLSIFTDETLRVLKNHGINQVIYTSIPILPPMKFLLVASMLHNLQNPPSASNRSIKCAQCGLRNPNRLVAHPRCGRSFTSHPSLQPFAPKHV